MVNRKGWCCLPLLMFATSPILVNCGSPEKVSSNPKPDKPPTYASSSPSPTPVDIPMRDGVVLKGTLMKPENLQKFPVILSRTPYGRGPEFPEFVRRGYGVLSEDVRGRGESVGKWVPMLNERNDGYDTVEWIAKQPWSDGNVGMIGASYGGYVQWAAAATRPPHLRCIVPIVSPPDPYQNLPYENGCFLLPTSLWYTSIIGKDTPQPATKRLPQIEALQSWPITEIDQKAKGVRNDIFQDWIRRESAEDWKSAETIQDASKSDMPSLSISGWFDGDEIGTQLRWASSKFKDRWLVYGPWGHGQSLSSQIGDLKIVPGKGPDTGQLELAFFAQFLRGEGLSLNQFPHVQAFALGANKWFQSETWPLPTAQPQKWFMRENQKLSDQIPKVSAFQEYEMDPRHVHATPALERDPLDDTNPYLLTEKDLSYGHLLYSGPAFSRPTLISGPLAASIEFSADTPDVDFYFQPFDALPNGKLMPIGEGGRFRARKLLGISRLIPGKHYQAKVPIWDSFYQIPAGHRLSLVISSDRFPVYALNPNSAEPLATATHPIKTHPKVYGGPYSFFEFSIMDPLGLYG